MTGEQKPGGLEFEGLSATYRFAYESIRNGAPGLSDATCAAIARSINVKVSVAAEPAEARIRELAEAMTVQADQWASRLAAMSDRATAAEAKRARAVEGLERIGIYGCGMLNQPAAMNGPNEQWLERRLAEYEREARQTLAALQQEGE